TNTAGAEIAEEVLGYAEAGWETQVVQMGFPTPTTVNDQEEVETGLWIYLDPAYGMDHPEALGDNPDTPWTDCTARVRISTLSPSSYLEMVTLHEMNHVLEYAADCGEPHFAIEQTTVAVTTISEPDDMVFTQYMLPVFQQNPHHSLHCTFYNDQNKFYFHYGSALFQLFLEEAYGSYDGALLGSIWNAAKQNGTVTGVGGVGAILDVPNDPDIFDAMNAVLGDTTLEEAYAEFARWRTFVGTRDDGAHFSEGASWAGGEIAIDTTLTLDSLPIVQGVTQFQPNELGSVYLSLDPYGIEPDQGVRLAFDGDDGVTWQVDALLLNADGTADVETLVVDETGRGELTVGPLADHPEVLVIFTNLGDGTRDPEMPHCAMGNGFVYDLSVVDLAAPPVISGVDPAELTVGEDHYLWVAGSDFVEGLQVTFGGAGISVTQVDFIDGETIGVALQVAGGAPTGSRDLTVTNPNDETTTLAGAVTVVDLDGSSTEVTSCGCVVVGDDPTQPVPWGLAALLTGLATLVTRRRWQG
ncbi:MAG: hypothetical protein JRI68_30770, partial [Deltaproteobacteria bacterium]|nr:hypothetical protein [Deltaproteobacteria bacterium]